MTKQQQDRLARALSDLPLETRRELGRVLLQSARAEDDLEDCCEDGQDPPARRREKVVSGQQQGK